MSSIHLKKVQSLAAGAMVEDTMRPQFISFIPEATSTPH